MRFLREVARVSLWDAALPRCRPPRQPGYKGALPARPPAWPGCCPLGDMKQFLPPVTLLLGVLLFLVPPPLTEKGRMCQEAPYVSGSLNSYIGLSRVTHATHRGTEGPREPREEAPGQGANGSHQLHHHVKRYLLPRTPPFQEPEPDFKVVNCKKSEGKCQKYCNYMELQLGYCFKTKDACCLPQN
ncbi:uncharacterized protein [Vicugna pacos]|uniref:Sperm-associated antigen 11-like n=1 Tax=Vicugna pacos TaxID=30538 RepID=A0ABM5CC46_VICPA